jgi:hypothetical protein
VAARSIATLAAALAATLTSCSWQEFSALERRAPVQSIGRPSDMSSADFPAGVDARVVAPATLVGSPILPVDHPRAHGELLILGESDLALADYTFDGKGQGFSATIPKTQLLLPPAQATAIPAFDVVAPAPATADAPRFVGVANQSPDHQPVLVTLATATTPLTVSAIGAPLKVAATGVVAGPITATDALDVAIVAGSVLYVRSATGGASYECPLTGQLLGVALGAGGVLVTTGADLSFVDPATCTKTSASLTAGGAGFGAALAVGPTDDTGHATVAVSAPGDPAAYLFDLVTTPAVALTVAPDAIVATGASSHFGESLAYGAYAGGETALAIGDPGDPGETGEAGQIWLYRPSTGLTTIARPSTSVMNFGARVGTLPFLNRDGVTVELLLGAASAATSGDPGVVYVFFKLDTEEDPRAL